MPSIVDMMNSDLEENLLWILIYVHFREKSHDLELIANIIKKVKIESPFDFLYPGKKIESKVESILTKEEIKTLAKIQEVILRFSKKSDYYFRELEKIKLPPENDKLIVFTDSMFPEKLKKIKDPPLVIAVRGEIPNLERAVAIVGRRTASSLALMTALEAGKLLAEKKFVVVSGLAYGIDTFAHVGCLSKNGLAIGVLGTPISRIYPKINKVLFNEIVQKGALISDVFVENKLLQKKFYLRNRLISALSKTIIIMESNESGGTITQIKYAKEQEKRVLMFLPPKNHYHYNVAKKIASKYELETFTDLEELPTLLE